MSGTWDAVRRRDEILQVMYWMRGERLGEAATVADLLRFLDDVGPALVEADLARLCEAGLLATDETGWYRLTELGVHEGARRFADEFAGLLGQAHGACSDPGCDCHELGPAACSHGHEPTDGQ